MRSPRGTGRKVSTTERRRLRTLGVEVLPGIALEVFLGQPGHLGAAIVGMRLQDLHALADEGVLGFIVRIDGKTHG